MSGGHDQASKMSKVYGLVTSDPARRKERRAYARKKVADSPNLTPEMFSLHGNKVTGGLQVR